MRSVFVACLVDLTRDCKLSVECVALTTELCLGHLRSLHGAPELTAEVLPGEERDGWLYVPHPGSRDLYYQVFEVTVAGGLTRQDAHRLIDAFEAAVRRDIRHASRATEAEARAARTALVTALVGPA